jgi:hypothetical protein
MANLCWCCQRKFIERRRCVVREETLQGGRKTIGPRDGGGHQGRVRPDVERNRLDGPGNKSEGQEEGRQHCRTHRVPAGVARHEEVGGVVRRPRVEQHALLEQRVEHDSFWNQLRIFATQGKGNHQISLSVRFDEFNSLFLFRQFTNLISR